MTLFVRHLGPNYIKTGWIEWAEIYWETSTQKSVVLNILRAKTVSNKK